MSETSKPAPCQGQPHPEVSAFFAAIKSFGAPPLHTLPVEHARMAYARSTDIFGGRLVELASVENFSIPGPESQLPVRLYKPHGLPAGLAPVLLYLHGGGWTIGSIDTHDRVCRQLAAGAGCAVLALEYRLAPEHPLPAASHDSIAALHWVRDTGAEHGLDAARMAVAGDSAGGALAAVLAHVARDAGFTLRAQVLFYPSTDLRASAEYGSRRRNHAWPLLDAATAEWFGRHSRPDPSIGEDWHVSVMAAESAENIAPALIFTAGLDILHDEGNAYATRLEEAGVEVARHHYPGMIHGFITLGGALSTANVALAEAASFLKQHLGA